MARRKYEEEHENHERWLVSYADFITLLFAFFVVMYAISSVNESKYRVLSDSLGNAFGQTRTQQTKPVSPPPILPLPSKTLIHKPRITEAVRREREQMTHIARNILKVLAPLVSEGKVRVTQTAWGVSVEINASLLFALGEAKLTDESSQALKAVAAVLKNDQHAIRVEGYTDDLPISNVIFPSNWELSAMRASSVVRLFGDNGIAENRLTAVGHGSNEPVDSNETATGRARNRRVTVTILSALPEVVTEVPVNANPKN
ncbi:MAG: flagellar motor protein MotD [Sulfuriferula sp.]